MSDPGRRQRLITTIRERSRKISPIPTGIVPRLAPLPSVRWIVFDVYGTLLTSGAGEIGTLESSGTAPAESCEQIIRSYGKPGISGSDLVHALIEQIRAEHRRRRSAMVPHPEVDILEIWRHLIDTFLTPPRASRDGIAPSPSTLHPENLAVDHELAVNPVWPMPGALETIGALYQNGYNLGIVSNAQFYTPLFIEALFGAGLEKLGISRCTWSYQIRAAKPSPAIFERFLSPHDAEPIDPSTALYIGNDMRNDICAAAAQGFRTALFAGDARSLRLREEDPSLCRVEPDLIVTDLRQLLEVFSRKGDRTGAAGRSKGSVI